jgi:hypothetical protein
MSTTALGVAVSGVVLVGAGWFLVPRNSPHVSDEVQASSRVDVAQTPAVPAQAPAEGVGIVAPLVDARQPQSEAPNASQSQAALPSGPGVSAEASISGLVLVSGARPGRPILLQLAPEQRGPQLDEQWTTADGRFEFQGLPAGSRARIRLPARYRYVDPAAETRAQSLLVSVPADGLVLHIAQKPGILGRLIDPRDGTPVREGVVNTRLTLEGGTNQDQGAQVDPDGEFFISTTASPTTIELEARVPGALGSFHFEAGEIPVDLHLGDLELSRGRAVRFRVLDSDRMPIPAATIRYGTQLDRLEQQTDVEGFAELAPLPEGPCRIAILARGFELERLEAPANDAPAEVVLRRANQLTIRVVSDAGSPVAGMRIRITGEGDIFTSDPRYLDPLLIPQSAGRGLKGGSTPSGGNYCLYVTDEKGLVELQSVRPEIPLELTVEDRVQQVGYRESIAPMGSETHRELTIRLTAERFSFEVLVVDPDGVPVQGANVRLIGPSSGLGDRTSEAGLAAIPDLFRGAAKLRVDHEDFEPLELPRVDLAAGLAPLRVALQRKDRAR